VHKHRMSWGKDLHLTNEDYENHLDM